RAGDRLVAVDGVPLLGGPDEPAAVLRRQLEAGAPRLSLTVLREGELRVLNGPVRAWSLPGYTLELQAAAASATAAAVGGSGEGCGRISLVGMPPRTRNV